MNKNKQRRPIHLTPNQRFGIRLLGKKLKLKIPNIFYRIDF